MNKYFKHYLALLNIIGLIIFIIANLKYPLILNDLWFILLIFSVISEILGIHFSANKNVSLIGALSVVSLFFLNITSTLFLIVCLQIIINCIRKFYIKELDKFFNDKFFFNICCFIISISSASIIYLLPINYLSKYAFIIKLLLMVIVHNIINYTLVALVIYLYTSDKREARFELKQLVLYSFHSFMTSLFLIIGYKDYHYFGLISVYIFIAPFQSKMLSSAIGDELRNNLYSDTLTNAYNRNYLDKVLADKLNHRVPFTILFMDFNKFKLINDTYGHLVGDKILAHFVQLIKKHLDDLGNIFRYGGDEFCIILNDPKNKTLIIEKLNVLSNSYQIIHDNQMIKYSVTIGDYTYNGEKDIKSYQILEQVDKLMYEKK